MLVTLYILNPHVDRTSSLSFPPNAHPWRKFSSIIQYVHLKTLKKASRHKQLQVKFIFNQPGEAICFLILKIGIYLK